MFLHGRRRLRRHPTRARTRPQISTVHRGGRTTFLRGAGRMSHPPHSAAAADVADETSALERDAICSNRLRRTHPALALYFGEHVYPAADRIWPDRALRCCVEEAGKRSVFEWHSAWRSTDSARIVLGRNVTRMQLRLLLSLLNVDLQWSSPTGGGDVSSPPSSHRTNSATRSHRWRPRPR
jgi:hypothetical protein